MPIQIDVRIAQLRLMILWLISVLPSFVILVIRTVGENSANMQKQWGWLLASVMPTLSLVIGTYAASTQQQAKEKTADLTFFRITFGLSLAYVILVTVAVVFCVYDRDSPMTMLDNISVVLGPVQGLVSAALGVFFVSQKEKPRAQGGRAARSSGATMVSGTDGVSEGSR